MTQNSNNSTPSLGALLSLMKKKMTLSLSSLALATSMEVNIPSQQKETPHLYFYVKINALCVKVSNFGNYKFDFLLDFYKVAVWLSLWLLFDFMNAVLIIA